MDGWVSAVQCRSCSCIPLQLALRRFVGAGGWVQHLGRVGHGEQGASFVVALA